jgi:hypothetical protein
MPAYIYLKQLEKWYTYIFWNPLKPGCPPFYVGKGSGKRVYDHLYSWSEKANPNTYRTIRQIVKAGKQPIITIVYSGLDEAKALWIERFLIALWKRECNGGILTNLLKGGEGSSG